MNIKPCKENVSDEELTGMINKIHADYKDLLRACFMTAPELYIDLTILALKHMDKDEVHDLFEP